MKQSDRVLEADAVALAELLLDIFEEQEAEATIVSSNLEGATENG